MAMMKSMSSRLVAKVKYSDNGTIKNATRTLVPGSKLQSASVENEALLEQVVGAYQSVITDTIVSFQVETVTEYEMSGTYQPGSVASIWDTFDDVKLINTYLKDEGNDNKQVRETIKRPATAATEEQLSDYATKAASIADGDMSAMQGYFTGSTVDTAWTND